MINSKNRIIDQDQSNEKNSSYISESDPESDYGEQDD